MKVQSVRQEILATLLIKHCN